MFNLEISNAELEAMGLRVERNINLVKSDVQLAMAVEFQDAVDDNFGFLGIDRPREWPPLSPSYAAKVQRAHATLEVTGELRAAVKVDNSDFDHSKVYASNSDVPYAVVHQYGGGNNIPARPYFPLEPDGTVTEHTAGRVREAAIQELRRALA